MEGQSIQEVSVNQSRPLTWPEEADIHLWPFALEEKTSARTATQMLLVSRQLHGKLASLVPGAARIAEVVKLEHNKFLDI